MTEIRQRQRNAELNRDGQRNKSRDGEVLTSTMCKSCREGDSEKVKG